jgi:hypothetical protein
MNESLCPEKGLIFRIVHRDNVPWILNNGLYCRNSNIIDPNYRTIGNPELIDKRSNRTVPIPPEGTLSDYVPFYFTPYSPMLYNIKTGWGGITKVPNEEIVIFVSSLHELQKLGIRFVFTDRHAYLQDAIYYSKLTDLVNISWELLKNKDFKRDENDLLKTAKYQAEALVFKHVPIAALLGVVCYNNEAEEEIRIMVTEEYPDFKIYAKPGWYFR